MRAPQVSVVLPTLNRARLLPRAIASVLNQSVPAVELIVVDDGSSDGTDAVVRSFHDPRVVYLRNERPTGDAAARNAGCARASGAWLAFQDSDDEWVPHKLALQTPLALEAAPDVAAIAGTVLRVAGGTVRPIEWPTDGPDEPANVEVERFVAGRCAYLQGLLIRKSAFEQVDGFDTSLKARSDFELCPRLLAQHRILATRDIVALSHESADGISGHAAWRRLDIERILAKHAGLIAARRSTHGSYLYDLARAQLACDERAAAARTTLRAIGIAPYELRQVALLALAPFGPRGLEWAAAVRRACGGPA